MACFDGQYPIELPAGNLIGKHLLEGVGKRAAMPDGRRGRRASRRAYDDRPALPLVASPGGGNALHHP